jgi:RNA-directed DNA polymerase
LKKARQFNIDQEWFVTAFKQVKANGGIAGVDGQTIEEFEENLENNLYKLWNRMASGSYFPKPVMRVEIPKGDGGTRPLGIPTVTDRIAQTVVKRYLPPGLLRVPPRTLGGRSGGSGAQAMLALRLGARPRHQGLL